MRARQDRQPDHVDVFVAGGGRDLLRREPDALVDDLHARVAGGHGDLFGPVECPSSPGFATSSRAALPASPSCALRRRADPRSSPRDLPQRRRPSGPGTRRTPHAVTPAHSPVVPPALANAIVGRHHVLARGGDPSQLVERDLDGVRVSIRAPGLHVGDELVLHAGIDREDELFVVVERGMVPSR